MQPERAWQILSSQALDRPEQFFGSDQGLSLGVGLLVDDVEFPTYDPSIDRFTVVEGLVLVLSHECDLDPANERFMNDRALICPVVRVEVLLADWESAGLSEEQLTSILSALAARQVSRAIYLPRLDATLPLGGIMYLNAITSTTVSRLNAGKRVSALTAQGLEVIDYALTNHLRRPKAEHLPLYSTMFRRAVSILGDFPKKDKPASS